MYLIRGASTANSSFFEKLSDCKLFLALADRYLGRFLTINSFQNNRDGWAMIITTRSADEIKRAYLARRAKSKKCNKQFEFKEVWRMLSDQVRILLSTYVKMTNSETRRSGGKVRCRYQRFAFESAEEAERMKQLLETEVYDQAQEVKRYRPSVWMSSIRARMIKTSVYVSSALLNCAEKVAELGMRCLDAGGFYQDVVRLLVNRTLHHHFPT